MELYADGFSRLWTLGSRLLPKAEVESPKPVSVKFEFLMVKLLRAYGECLGARSR